MAQTRSFTFRTSQVDTRGPLTAARARISPVTLLFFQPVGPFFALQSRDQFFLEDRRVFLIPLNGFFENRENLFTMRTCDQNINNVFTDVEFTE